MPQQALNSYVTWPKFVTGMTMMLGLGASACFFIVDSHAQGRHANVVSVEQFKTFEQLLQERHRELLRRLDKIDKRLETR